MTKASHPQFKQLLSAHAQAVEARLIDLLSNKTSPGEIQRPARLMEAIRHSALDGGKRLRPFLLTQSAALFGMENSVALNAACALECIHCYSLVHDDLPAMDDDALRRGKPTTHIAFDEATAILAGDGLLTLAFDILADQATHSDPIIRVELVSLLAKAAGVGGMVGGQVFDIAAETDKLSETQILQLQSMKTGALIRHACEAGAVLAGASQEDRARLVRFGEIIGLAFQLADDLLDVSADATTMGKATGKDADAGKKTFVTLYGIDGTKRRLEALLTDAQQVLAPFGEQADILQQTACFITQRDH